LIPAIALTFVGVILVRQQNELLVRRSEDQARLQARALADSLSSVLDVRIAAINPESSIRYPASNGILNLGRLEEGQWKAPFPEINSAFSETDFQRTIARLQEAKREGELTQELRETIDLSVSMTDEVGIPLSFYAMEVLGESKADFQTDAWLNFLSIEYAEDLGIDGFAHGEHELLRFVSERHPAIDGWKLSPDSMWMVTRANNSFFGVNLDSINSDLSIFASSAAAFSLAPQFPFLRGPDRTSEQGQFQILWILALSLVLVVTIVASTILFKDARREKRLSDLRAQFVSSVSHEVRTPLAAIRLYTDSLLAYGPGKEEEWRADLETISYETDRLTRMLDNVLRVSRIERGTDRFSRKEGDLSDPVERAVQAMMPALTEAGCELEQHIAELPAVFDRDAIEQAVVNLLSNAAKYAPQSSVSITCKSENNQAIISVSDTGSGMSDESKKRVFEPYFRGVQHASGSETGTGLGLSLVKHIVEGHDGSVSVESAPGSGSTFTLIIPLIS